MALIKSELVHRVAKKNEHLYQRDIEKVVTTILEEIVEALSRGDRVELRDFGVFSVKVRKPRVGRNPRTGETVMVSERATPFFKIGKNLHKRLNGTLDDA